MQKFNGCVAVITGAGSGIGRQLAYQLADAGAQLAISDIIADNLEETRAAVAARGAKVEASLLDVSDKQAFTEHAKEVFTKFGKVNLVINNAGVALASGPLWATPVEDFQWLMSINFNGVLFGTTAFLPYLEKSDWGHIVNISSLFGIVSTPTQTAYNASKFAVRGMTDSLRQELDIAGSHISATTVHPGGIKTNIVRSARISDTDTAISTEQHDSAANKFEKVARTTAESAARQILVAVTQNKRRLLIGFDAKLIEFIQRLLPGHYHRILNMLLGQKDLQPPGV